MLAPHAVDIAAIISSLIASLCFTFAKSFDDIFLFVKSRCALVSRNTTKVYDPRKEGRSDQLINQVSEFVQNSRKKDYTKACSESIKAITNLF